MTTDTPCPPCRSEHTDAPLLQGSGGGPTAPCSTEPKRDAAASAARKDTLARVILLEHARGCSSRTCAFGVDCSKMRIVLAHASTCPGFTEESSLGKMHARMEAQSEAIRGQCPDFPVKTAFEKRASRIEALKK